MRNTPLVLLITLALCALAPAGASARPMIGACPVFPAGDSFNQDISGAATDLHSSDYISEIQSAGNQSLHPDFGGGGQYGIPYISVPFTQKLKPVKFVEFGDQSDPGPYPIPKTAPVEGGGAGDSHVLAARQGDCRLFELYHAKWKAGKKRWNAGSGAVFDLTQPLQGQRPQTWTSADAAGLPILPGLVRYDEVHPAGGGTGVIEHAIRITFQRSNDSYLYPATHCAGNSSHDYAVPEGLRLRLNMSDTRLNTFTGDAKVILTAMRRYGVIMADNGSNWYFQGDGDPRWNDDDLHQLTTVSGSEFVVVDANGSSVASSQHGC